MVITPPFLLPGFLFAIFLCSFKSYWQAVVFMLGVAYVTESSDFFVLVMFTVISLILGHVRASVYDS